MKSMICKATDIDYEKVAELVGMDERIQEAP